LSAGLKKTSGAGAAHKKKPTELIPFGASSTTHGVVRAFQVIVNTFSFSSEKAALYRRFEQLKNGAGKFRIVERPGTHRGHNKLFLAGPRTPSSASVFL
jgi:hypothetical protein